MGNRKRGWTKGSVVVIIAIGFLFAGVFVSNYFQAKAASKPINLQKNEQKKQTDQQPDSKIVSQNTKDAKLEKEWIRKQQQEAVQEQKQEQNPVQTPAETKAAQPPTKETGTLEPPKQETTTPQSNQTQTPPVSASPGSKKTVYLTFDDGPAPFSGEIITLLEKYHFKATFFMIDGNIRRYPNSVKLMVQNGETVGLHSVSHSVKIFYASANSVISELNQNRNTLKTVSGIDSHIMRTPYGSFPYMTDIYKKAVKDQGYIMWDWNIDSKDWYYKDARYVSNVIEQINRKANHNGPLVILLHERKETLAHLPALLDYLSKQGFEGKAIDAMTPPVQF
ncbi:polysaccharide deacetylase family protein [Paenibacillus sp. BSR1-1]|uniref:polysaccharide deacetylase family protein n=1 Tax=Paenibacillus sp. BSR1-1 TaxID=3020845 RepID=UPI0025B0D4E6|nr:polysaccharide deacetylase family protein [Paenibacillus sp. BSR1-1]MDN3019719.1 polysaccharide deacetylase family protein [Paenibacillus sp. BSR1-1]